MDLNKHKNHDEIEDVQIALNSVTEKHYTEDINGLNAHRDEDEYDGVVVGYKDSLAPTNDNSFATKKTVAQGMMDIALITANANQLRYILESNQVSYLFYVSVSLIILSLVLQIIVGIGLILKGRFDIKGKDRCQLAVQLDNLILIGIFFITIINIFIASFNVSIDK